MSDTGGGIRDMDEGGAVGEGGRAALGREGPTPLYHRLYVIFREKILGGELRDGDVYEEESGRLRSWMMQTWCQLPGANGKLTRTRATFLIEPACTVSSALEPSPPSARRKAAA